MTGILGPKLPETDILFWHDSRCVPRCGHESVLPVAVLFLSKKQFFGRGLELPK